MYREKLNIPTPGRGLYELTESIQSVVSRSQINRGLCQVFIHHTSASLILGENADPSVQTDLESFLSRLAPDGDPLWTHRYEGPDDMPAHIRSVLTQNSLTLPVEDNRCDLGRWQGAFLWEHRHQGHQRQLSITVW